MMNYKTTLEIREAAQRGEITVRTAVRLIRQFKTCERIKREVQKAMAV